MSSSTGSMRLLTYIEVPSRPRVTWKPTLPVASARGTCAAGGDVDERPPEAERLLVVPPRRRCRRGRRRTAPASAGPRSAARPAAGAAPRRCRRRRAPAAPGRRRRRARSPASVQSVPGIRITCQPGPGGALAVRERDGHVVGRPERVLAERRVRRAGHRVEASRTLPPWPTTQPPTSASAAGGAGAERPAGVQRDREVAQPARHPLRCGHRQRRPARTRRGPAAVAASMPPSTLDAGPAEAATGPAPPRPAGTGSSRCGSSRSRAPAAAPARRSGARGSWSSCARRCSPPAPLLTPQPSVCGSATARVARPRVQSPAAAWSASRSAICPEQRLVGSTSASCSGRAGRRARTSAALSARPGGGVRSHAGQRHAVGLGVVVGRR